MQHGAVESAHARTRRRSRSMRVRGSVMRTRLCWTQECPDHMAGAIRVLATKIASRPAEGSVAAAAGENAETEQAAGDKLQKPGGG